MDVGEMPVLSVPLGARNDFLGPIAHIRKKIAWNGSFAERFKNHMSRAFLIAGQTKLSFKYLRDR